MLTPGARREPTCNMNEAADFLFRCNPEPGWIHDRETFRFLAVNEAAVARYGYSEDEFLRMTTSDIEVSEDLPRQMAPDGAANPEPQHLGRQRHRLKSGEIIIVEVRTLPVSFTGRPAQIVAARDMTELERLEKAVADQLRKEREVSALLSMAGRVARFGGWRVDLLKNEVVWSAETAAIHEVANEPTTVATGLNYYVPEHRQIIETAFRACIEDGVPFDLVLQIITGKGRRIWVRTIGEAERDAHGSIIAAWGAFQDIDELVAAQTRSEATQKRLSETLNSVSEGFMVLDQDWRLTFLNRAGAEFLMQTGQEIIGQTIWDLFPEARGSRFEASYQTAVATGEAVTFEEFYPPLDRWFEVRAHPTREGLAIYFRDVTDRHHSHEALRLSEERFRLVTTITSDVIWDWNLVDDSIWWNEHMALKFGHQTFDVREDEHFWENRIHPEDRPRVLARIRSVLEGSAAEWSDEYRFLKADGSVAHVVDRALILRDASGVGQRMVGSMTDVTARVAVEAQLREAQKLEAVGKLTGGLAHDFNNLLTVVIGTTEALAERLAGDPESRMLAETADAAARRGAELVSRLLAFARQQPLDPKKIDIGRLLRDFDPILRRTLSEDVDLEVAEERGLWEANIDPGQLEAALLNLVINARDAMPGGGRLAIRASNASLDEERGPLEESAFAGQYVMVSVSDTGSGMPPEVVSRVFEPFFTTKDVGKGSGLGLSMVYGFVKQSRGHVKIQSEVGEGTTISIYLPRARPSTPEVEEAPMQAAAPGPGHERILVVEDDPMVREHVTRQLRGLGYAVTEANDGSQALERLKRGEVFDLLFTDVVMPGGMNGRDLALAGQRIHPGLKVLFTSGYTETTMVHHGRLDPGVRLLSKPYRRRDLAERIRLILDE